MFAMVNSVYIRHAAYVGPQLTHYYCIAHITARSRETSIPH